MNAYSPLRIDTAISYADDFLRRERGVALEGSNAAADLYAHVRTVEEEAEELLTSIPTQNPDYRLVLGAYNAQDFARVASGLPGYTVLIPSSLVDGHDDANVFYRAVVGEADYHNALRLHVLCTPFLAAQRFSLATETVLSAAVEAEVGGLAAHGTRLQGDEVSAPHLLTLLSAAADPAVARAWRRGVHVDEAWRRRHERQGAAGRPLAATSATAEMHARLSADTIHEATVVLSAEDFSSRRALLLWHASMRDTNGRPETAAKQNALVVAQALGIQALRERHGIGAIDTMRRLINP